MEINSGAFDPKKMMRIPFDDFPREQAEFMRVDEDLSDSVQLLAGSLAGSLAVCRLDPLQVYKGHPVAQLYGLVAAARALFSHILTGH